MIDVLLFLQRLLQNRGIERNEKDKRCGNSVFPFSFNGAAEFDTVTSAFTPCAVKDHFKHQTHSGEPCGPHILEFCVFRGLIGIKALQYVLQSMHGVQRVVNSRFCQPRCFYWENQINPKPKRAHHICDKTLRISQKHNNHKKVRIENFA